MIVDKSNKPKRPLEIDLSGPEGNVFNLMSLAMRMSKDFGYNGEAIVNLMKAGTYDEAVQVFDAYFGKHVIIYK